MLHSFPPFLAFHFSWVTRASRGDAGAASASGAGAGAGMAVAVVESEHGEDGGELHGGGWLGLGFLLVVEEK